MNSSILKYTFMFFSAGKLDRSENVTGRPSTQEHKNGIDKIRRNKIRRVYRAYLLDTSDFLFFIFLPTRQVQQRKKKLKKQIVSILYFSLQYNTTRGLNSFGSIYYTRRIIIRVRFYSNTKTKKKELFNKNFDSLGRFTKTLHIYTR